MRMQPGNKMVLPQPRMGGLLQALFVVGALLLLSPAAAEPSDLRMYVTVPVLGEVQIVDGGAINALGRAASAVAIPPAENNYVISWDSVSGVGYTAEVTIADTSVLAAVEWTPPLQGSVPTIKSSFDFRFTCGTAAGTSEVTVVLELTPAGGGAPLDPVTVTLTKECAGVSGPPATDPPAPAPTPAPTGGADNEPVSYTVLGEPTSLGMGERTIAIIVVWCFMALALAAAGVVSYKRWKTRDLVFPGESLSKGLLQKWWWWLVVLAGAIVAVGLVTAFVLLAPIAPELVITDLNVLDNALEVWAAGAGAGLVNSQPLAGWVNATTLAKNFNVVGASYDPIAIRIYVADVKIAEGLVGEGWLGARKESSLYTVMPFQLDVAGVLSSGVATLEGTLVQFTMMSEASPKVYGTTAGRNWFFDLTTSCTMFVRADLLNPQGLEVASSECKAGLKLDRIER